MSAPTSCRRLTAFAVALALVLASRAASAQRSGSDADFDAALAEGRRLYEVREWDKAIERFKAAYTIREDPRALFNIAQAYRLKGDCASAASVYKTFKRKFPKDENIERVEKFIVEMEKCAEAAAASQPVDQPVDRQPVEPAPAAADPSLPAAGGPDVVESAPGGSSRSRVPLYVMGGGAALVAGAVATHVFLLRPVRDDLAEAARAHDESDYKRLEKKFDTRRAWTIGLYAAGGIAVASGVVLHYTLFRGEEAPAQVSLVPQAGGAVVSLQGSL